MKSYTAKGYCRLFCNMKRVIPLMISAILSACSLLDPPLTMGKPRFDTGSDMNFGEDTGKRDMTADTTVLVSCIRYEEGYDWRRDTAWHAAGSELMLIRLHDDIFAGKGPGHEGFEVIEAVSTGRKEKVSPGPDLHHIIGGHLYTEYSDESGTCLKKDGELLFNYPEQEILCGIIDTCGKVFTLGRSKTGFGLNYRENGRIVVESPDGVPFGYFNDMSYGAEGALYPVDGKISFTYRRTLGAWEEIVAVSGGEERLVSSRESCTTHDARILEGGRVYWVSSESGKTVLRSLDSESDISCRDMKMEEGKILFPRGGPYVFAFFRDGSSRCCGIPFNGSLMHVGTPPDLVYEQDGWFGILQEDSFKDCYLPSRNCAAMLDRELIVALTPRTSGYPYVLWHGRKTEIEINGFVSGIEVEISPPRK